MPDFIFVTCQLGAEKAVRTEIARQWPQFRFAYSQHGFLTFKLPDQHGLADNFDLKAVFARSYGFSLGKKTGTTPDELATEVWSGCKGHTIQRVHIWELDRALPGDHGYEPALTPLACAFHQTLLERCPYPRQLAKDAQNMSQAARPHELVLDCILTTPDSGWIGYHRAHGVPSCYPGGLMSLEMPPQVVSRAWLKMEEALRWSQLPISPGARVAEIGSAPGGASQALLAHGFVVTGIDPAEMAPAVLENPRFKHIRRRSAQVPRRDFRKIRWLTADMNVTPNYTLDAIEEIVTHREVNIRGMLLTLKLPDWGLSQSLPDYIARIRSWGYNVIQARQLQHNRREVCVVALQKPFRRKAFKE
jgi:23S rRNA (cytidine2498-2'-O)-methyltransferase